MSDSTTAQIIQFPARPATPIDAVAQGAPPDRLTLALASLEAALAEQRAALAGWRDSMDQLRKSTAGLGLSLQRYQRTLGKLGEDVDRLKGQNQEMERWATQAIAKAE